MLDRIKDLLPDNRNTALLAFGMVLLLAGQLLSKTTNIFLVILRYGLFIAAVVIYFIVARNHHRARLAKKRAQENQEN